MFSAFVLFLFFGFSPLYSNLSDRIFDILVSDFNKTHMLQKSEEMPCKTPLALPNPLQTSKQKQPSGWLWWLSRVVVPAVGQRANLDQGIWTRVGWQFTLV